VTRTVIGNGMRLCLHCSALFSFPHRALFAGSSSAGLWSAPPWRSHIAYAQTTHRLRARLGKIGNRVSHQSSWNQRPGRRRGDLSSRPRPRYRYRSHPGLLAQLPLERRARVLIHVRRLVDGFGERGSDARSDLLRRWRRWRELVTGVEGER
jgi:hypothetical protein